VCGVVISRGLSKAEPDTETVIFQRLVTHFTYPIRNNMKQGCVMSHEHQAKKIKRS
jgi:hypothetical protein